MATSMSSPLGAGVACGSCRGYGNRYAIPTAPTGPTTTRGDSYTTSGDSTPDDIAQIQQRALSTPAHHPSQLSNAAGSH